MKRKERDEGYEAPEYDVVDVDFDIFDLKEDDFLSVKSLLRQLLGVDSTFFNLSSLAQSTVDSKVGSAVKADDEEYNDVLAMLSVVDCSLEEGSETRKLVEYWIERTSESQSPKLNKLLRQILHRKIGNNSVGIIFSDRFLNMPFDVVAPMYSMMAQECIARGVSYEYILIPSRIYTEIVSTLDNSVPQPSAKKSAGKQTQNSEIFRFHAEDEVIDKVSVGNGAFDYKTPIDETDSRRAFQENGILPHGTVAVIKGSDLARLAAEIENMSTEG